VKFLLIIVLLLFSLGCTLSVASTADKPAHHIDGGYKNLHVEAPDKGFFAFMQMRFLGEDKWADHQTLAAQVPVVPINIPLLQQPSQRPQTTWLGHSTFLVQYQGINILTDPIFSDRASPISFAGPKRYTPHVIDYAKLPKIDFVIISHNHYDHLDTLSLQKLDQWSEKSTQFYVPLGLKALLVEQGIHEVNVLEFDWWDKINIDKLSIQAMPAQHWSARGLFDSFDTLWASWSIHIDDFSLWFAGDTGYNPVQFKEIGEYTKGFDLALIPIGAYAPRWFMQYYHINPVEALKIHQDVQAKQSIGMHWGTFPLTAEEPGAPVIGLNAALEAQNMPTDEFITLAIGQTITIDR
jgi:N-acyl-phosphatidylethanolamine-hydrolysing phospholipase D